MFKFFTILFFLFSFNLSAEVVQKLNVKGNNRISEETIKVYGGISLGKDYSNSQINEILKNLYDTNFFEDIKISLTSGTLSVAVKEYAVINFIDLDGEKSNNIKKSILEKLNLKIKESFIENKLN